MSKKDAEKIDQLIANLVDQGGGQFTIAHDPDDETTPWLIGSTFGREAEDSPMAGGAIYGVGKNLAMALDMALGEL